MLDKYDYILFDWDGTLVKSLDRWHGALKQSLEDHGYELSAKDIGANYQLFSERALSLAINNADEVINDAYKYLESLPQTPTLSQGAKDVLKKLQAAGKKLAVVTTSTHRQIDEPLKTIGVDLLFDVVVCADDVTNLKPHPEPIELALSKLGGEPNRAIMIGDSSADILAAKAAGIDSILYFPKSHMVYYERKNLKDLEPTYTVSSMSELNN